MKQVLLELPDDLAEELEQVAPGRERKRSSFLREAIRKALDEVAEQRMAAAYRAQPDDAEPPYLDPEAWEPRPTGRRPKSKRS